MAYGTVSADIIQSSVPGVSLGAGNASTLKNRIINGAMVIDQRNAGASVSGTSNVYTVDRWAVQNNSGSARFNVQQNGGSVTPPVGFVNYLGVTSTGAYSVASSDVIGIQQFIEGYNIADLNWGTVNAKTVTLSFWVRSSLTGTFGGSLIEGNSASAFYPFTYTISSANTWTQVSITIAGPTIGTWATTNSRGIQVLFDMGVGSTYQGTAGSWTASSYYAPTGATSVVGTNGATFYITGVQLEVGSSATGFEYRQYGQELALCQRYCPTITAGQSGSGFFSTIGVGFVGSTTQFYTQINVPVTTRVAPTGLTVVGAASGFTVNPFIGSAGTVTSVTFQSASSTDFRVLANTSGMTNSGQSGDLAINNSATYMYFTGCEL